MKKIFGVVACIMVLLLCAACSNEEEKYFRVGMECNYAPYNWTQSTQNEFTVPIEGGGYADGYDVQMAKLLSDKLGLELVIVKTEWDGLTLSVNSGKIDAIIAGMNATPERRTSIDFTNPYYQFSYVVVTRKDGDFCNAKSINDFKSARITGQLNTTLYDLIDQMVGAEKMTAVESVSTMIVSLQSGKIDGFIIDKPGAMAATLANDDLMYIDFEEGKGFNVDQDEISASIGIKKNSEFDSKINEILDSISTEQRNEMMKAAISRQPLVSEGN